MSRNDESPEQTPIPQFHEVLENLAAAQSSDAAEGEQSETPAELQRSQRVVQTPWCARIGDAVDWLVARRCDQKQNQLRHCDEHDRNDCPCMLPGGANRLVDLVVLVDGTMIQLAAQIDAALREAIERSKQVCPSDLRVQGLTVDTRRPGTAATGTGGFPGTLFVQTHEQYLRGLGILGPFAHDAPSGGNPPAEQGADAIADVSQYFNWRPGACRAVFYISDTTLDAGVQQDAADVSAGVNAVVQASANQVAVSAYLVTPTASTSPAATQADYQNLTSQTGGSLHVGPPNQGSFMEQLLRAICAACVARCVEARIPQLQPCVSIRWGDSRCDCMETDDTEVLCITVCNCYSNVTLSDLSIGYVFVTDANGNAVPTLPDGTPSVEVRPLGPICFGDIPPCRDGEPGCVSREVVLLARGARAGSYRVQVGAICFSATFAYQTDECFRLELCRD